MTRVLLCASTTGYQTRAFEDAAGALGVRLVYATDRCDRLADPWRDGAIAVPFSEPGRAAHDVVRALVGRPLDGVLAVGDRPAVLAACVAREIGLTWHDPNGAMAAHDKLLARGRLMAAGLPVPWFVSLDDGQAVDSVADRLRFPCVVKPATLSASRGVMRADNAIELDARLSRLSRLLRGPDVAVGRQGESEPAHRIIIEGFIPGREYALEGVMDRGMLHVLATFDKPDPLDGPFFEETIYVTPPLLPEPVERLMAATIAHAAHALGLTHGPVHAECRLNEEGVFVLEVAARPIGGLCARTLRFVTPARALIGLEELLLRHAVGESLEGFSREPRAAGVMMMPVPGRGHFRTARGLDEARAVAGIEDVVIAARPGQLLEPWPEGHSYPGFIFARGASTEEVTAALRAAHGKIRLELDTALPLA